MYDLMSIYKALDQGKNREALEYTLNALEEAIKQSNEYMSLLNALGYVYCNLTEYEKAIKVYDEYINIAKQSLDKENLHIGYHQKAMALRLCGKYDEALDCIIKEREIITMYFFDDNLKTSVNEYEYGYILFLIGHIDEGYTHMKSCLDHALKTDDLIAQACAYRGSAEILLKIGDISKANELFDKAYALFTEANDTIGAEELLRLRKS